MLPRTLAALALLLAVALLPVHPGQAGGEGLPRGFRPVQKLLDLSGLAWLGGDTFLAVHDAKFPDEARRVRVSLIQLPASLDGLQWKPLRPHFRGRPSSDLESASRIPGTRDVLLVESGDDGSDRDRIFLASVGRRVRVVDWVEWSSFTSAFNVEGTAVAETPGGHLFVWAERAEGESSTVVSWTDLQRRPFAIGTSAVVGTATFSLPDELAQRYNRPLVGLDVGEDGTLYSVAAADPDSDFGPYASAVLAIGRVVGSGVVLDAAPTLIAVQDGFKIESVAVRGAGASLDLFAGTDDENYGGTLRPLPLEAAD